MSPGQDRSEQKFPWTPVEADRRISELSFLDVANDLDDSVLIADKSHTVQFVNAAFERRSGYAAEEIVGKNVNVMKSGLVPSHVYRELWEAISHGQPWRAQLINRRKDGALYEVDLSISPVFQDNEPTWFVGMQRDISENKRLQRASAHMASLGAMAAGVVNDLRNPLTAIGGSAQVIDVILAGMESGSPELRREAAKIRRALETTQSGINSLGKLIGEITDLVREIPSAPVIVSAAEIIASALRLSEHFLDGVRVMKDIDPEPCLYVSAIEIERALINLLSNAAWAARLSKKTPEIRISVDSPAQNELRIRVADNGPGIPAEVADKLFAFSVTTKPSGEGAGLGLLTVGELVKKNHGEVKLVSTGATGTVFTLQFPRAACP